jgi:membrane associated rhomboid family serine protease
LLFNMLMLVLCGVALERVLGGPSLIVLYLVSAVTSAAAQWAVAPLSMAPVIGASGAISGVIGAYALSFGRPKRVTGNAGVNRLIHIVWLAVAWTLLQIGVGYAAGTEGLLVATPAHIGGFITGLLLQRPLLLWRYRKA